MVVPGAKRRYLVVKRIFDFVVCLVALPVVFPLIVITAIVVYLDSPGPIFFGQERTGQHGLRFKMWKFRTMVPNAEDLKASLQHLNVLPAPDFKIIDDPRITRVGRILRASSLDELPQIWNILRGQMSLVGPRPTSFAASTYDLWHTYRLEVMPGITGLWQVSGRSDLPWDETVALDMHYVDHWSLGLDLTIMARTPMAILRGSGAY